MLGDSHPIVKELNTGWALRELDIQMIPACSPQARGRRNFGTWQGRLPHRLWLAGIATMEAANEFLRQHYVAEFNRRFQVQAAQSGNAFASSQPRSGLDLRPAIRAHRESGNRNLLRNGFSRARDEPLSF